MYQSTTKTDNFFMMTREALNNGSTHPEISELLSKYGYHPKRIYEGQLLYEASYGLYQKQHSMQQKKTLIKNQMNEVLKELRGKHLKFYHIGQILRSENPEIGIQLGLNKKRKKNFAGRIHQMDFFYKTLSESPELIEKYQHYSISTDDIKTAQDLLVKVVQLKESYNALKSESQQATEDKNESIKTLKKWMTEYQGIARYALKDKAQYLEKLGILVKSKGVVA